MLDVLAAATTPQISSANNTEHLAIISLLVTPLGGALAAGITALVQQIMSRGKWASEAKADAVASNAQEVMQVQLNQMQVELDVADKVTEAWRLEHSMTDRELDRRFDDIEHRIGRRR